ncbi:hypothetical protein SAMN04488063_0807 [Halopelagius inordinatus]|uniref:Uncharacterized protein n=1 Tax=Halopelagius inordinatus TaxID=553467 RepID=A0A1I2ML44_9EURY|nr:ribonuclease BN [Halopelagius inordinatus]SFF92224.1 hypothetical protein SAMN04488063_0807 [Halopelagius inordinatus]
MTSLSEVYHGGERSGPSLRRLTFGLGLFLVGALLVVAGIVVASTDLLIGAGTTLGDVRELGGILGGVGVPAVFLGVFAVLPSGRLTKAAAVVGAAIALMGVVLFSHAYPCQWSGATCGQGLTELTLPTVAVYFLGTITTFWCLFVGVANFKTRNDPGGTATVEVTKKGETRYVEVERSRGGLGGIGFLGGQPDGDVDTQTAAASERQRSDSSPASAASLSDGGTDAQSLSSPMDSASGGRPQSTPADTYCGNCDHFEYVRTDEGIQPYCGRHDELMDDMDPCDEWTPR